jgi:hypothetical protein
LDQGKDRPGWRSENGYHVQSKNHDKDNYEDQQGVQDFGHGIFPSLGALNDQGASPLKSGVAAKSWMRAAPVRPSLTAQRGGKAAGIA